MNDLNDQARRPTDLETEEMAVAGWMAHLRRVDAPAHLRAAVEVAILPRAGTRWGTGRWSVAVAAMLLMGLGVAALGSTAGDVGETSAPAPVAVHQVHGGPAGNVVVVDDPNMVLFHGVETFDSLGSGGPGMLADR